MDEASRLRGHIIAMIKRIGELHTLKRIDGFVSLWYAKAPDQAPAGEVAH